MYLKFLKALSLTAFDTSMTRQKWANLKTTHRPSLLSLYSW